MSTFKALAVAGIAVVSLAGVGSVALEKMAGPAPKRTGAKADPELEIVQAAKGACRLALAKVLHDPGSVQWDDNPGWYTERRGDGSILVQPRARAKNRMGAYVLGAWDCVARPEGGDIRIVSLKQIR